MDTLQQFLNVELIRVSGHMITVGEVLAIPVFVIVTVLLIRWLVRVIGIAMARRGINADVIQIVKRAMTVLGLVLIFITTLDLLKVPLTAFAFVSGAIAIGVGFGAQNIINNFISGWILMWERPIRINDFIELGDTNGTVEEINTRSTRIRRVDGVHMLVPNSKLLEETVVNWTLLDELLRSVVRVGVAYGSDVQLVRELIERAASEIPSVLKEPAPQVIFEDFGDSALIFDLYFWVYAGGDKTGREIRSEVRFEIDRLFRENDVVISFPQRDVHLDGELRITSQGSSSEVS